jgi:hypothetical protein
LARRAAAAAPGEPVFEVRSSGGVIGLRSVAIADMETRELRTVALHPFANQMGAHPFELDHFELSENRVEARAVGSIVAGEGEDAEAMSCAFYDVHWPYTRFLTPEHKRYAVFLTMIAYVAQPGEARVITMPTPGWMREMAEKGDPAFAERGLEVEQTLDLSEMKMLIDHEGEGGRADDYDFRGRVVEVRETPERLLDVEAWVVRAAVVELG